jgi:pimeloyl-ACP methyl ester carboxylesterase
MVARQTGGVPVSAIRRLKLLGSPTTPVRMVESVLSHRGRHLRYAVSDNTPLAASDEEPIWAVNIHGYFAGGGMYWRESAALAAALGWRVVNPCMPGFGDSDPIPRRQLTIGSMADHVEALLDHVGVERAVLLGHSMGGAIAVEFGARRPDRTLGIVYRDGIATPAWRTRGGVVASALRVLPGDLGGTTDLMVAAMLDWPDLLVGRNLISTMRRLWPDARDNVRSMGGAMAVGSMLMSLDLRPELARTLDAGVPYLPVWGCFDRVATAATAREFSQLSGEAVVWVPGGHSWMLPRPKGQADVLIHLDPGRRFVASVEQRRGQLERRPGRGRPGLRRADAAG